MEPTTLEIEFLGTGTSTGVPMLRCLCPVCLSTDERDKRLRTSVIVRYQGVRLLIDCGPDFRTQMLRASDDNLDAVLLTHIHYDHVGGLDDLRPYCQFGEINIYADERTSRGLMQTVPYCFAENRYPGVPQIHLHTLTHHVPIQVNELQVMPIQVMHGKLPITGYRIGKLAYITDMKTIAETELPYLEGVETLVVNALRFNKEHHTHQTVEDAIAFSEKIGSKHTYLIHSCHEIGLHEEVNKQLPAHIQLAYDGQVIDI